LTIAEESTAFPAVTQPVHLGGLGFHFKWNMGWMNDTLRYASLDPIHRRFHHHLITFSFVYAWSEKYLLPLSHDEVVHGKRSLAEKMPGDRWQRFANYRWLRAYMTAHPGKKLLFMGQEFGQSREWNHDHSLDWHEYEAAGHSGLVQLNRELNALYARAPRLYASDPDPEGFRWIDLDNAEQSVFAFLRRDPSDPGGAPLVCVFNATPVPRSAYQVGVDRPGAYRALLDTDAARFGGSGYGRREQWMADTGPWHGFPHSLRLDLPPLAAILLSAAA
jgi:1,4-alpha-glucan branching enzyme